MRERQQRGFTIIEAIIVILIVAIGLAAGVPSIQEALERRRVTGVLEDINSRIALARSEAIKRGENVSVTFVRTAADDWCMGLQNDTTAACDCTSAATSDADFCGFSDAADPTIKVSQRLTSEAVFGVELTTSAGPFDGDFVFAFDPVTGTLENLADTGSLVITSTSGDYEVQITVSPSGLSSACLTSNSSGLGSYVSCP